MFPVKVDEHVFYVILYCRYSSRKGSKGLLLLPFMLRAIASYGLNLSHSRLLSDRIVQAKKLFHHCPRLVFIRTILMLIMFVFSLGMSKILWFNNFLIMCRLTLTVASAQIGQINLSDFFVVFTPPI